MSTPHPMPKGMKTVIRERIRALIRASTQIPHDYDEMAEGVQDIWPGATAQQVRGVASDLGRSSNKGRHDHQPLVAREPWKPGTPKPTDLSQNDKPRAKLTY